jgi:DNA invertase Pin-like site-specific DNA recombinase
MTTTTVQAREYLRVSKDKSGRARSVEEQHDDNVAAGQVHGFTLAGQPYSDVSLSASRYARKVRGDFARLLADLEHGRFGADLLVLWESSRGSRRVGEWATLVDLLEDARVKVHVATHGRTYDPRNPRDRRTLMEDAVDAEYASGKASDAIQRAAKATAERGEAWGRIPFGYRRTYDPVTRRLVSQDPDPGEAAVVREVFTRLRRGDTLHGIARDFAARGITTRAGRPFTPQAIRNLALRPVYAGLRVHEPGNREGRYRGSLDALTAATWPALVDRETFTVVRGMLLDPGRKTSRPGRGKHLLSLIAACDICGSELTATFRYGARQYVCRGRACVRVDADGLDTVAERAIVAYLARPDVIAGLRVAGDDSPELAQVRADLVAARTELADWRRLAKERKVTAESFAEIEPGIVRSVTDLEARETELSTPSALLVIPPGRDAARRWAAAEMPARRQVARLLLSRQVIGQLRVTRTPQPGSKPADAADRVVWLREDVSTGTA